MKYRCLFEESIDVDAESEEDAQRKAAEALCAELREEPDRVIVWPMEPPPDWLEKPR